MSSSALERTDSQKLRWEDCAALSLSNIMDTYPVDRIAYRIQESTQPLRFQTPGPAQTWVHFFQKKLATYSKRATLKSVLAHLHLVMTNYLYCMETGREIDRNKWKKQDPYHLKKDCKCDF